MEDFTKGANPSALAIKSIKITDAAFANDIGEDYLRASLETVASNKEPARVNPTFPSYYQLVGEKLQLRASSSGISKPFAEIIFNNGKAPSQSQIAKLMGAINPPPKNTPKQKDNPKSHP